MICPNCSNQTYVLIDDLCPHCKMIQSLDDDQLIKWIVIWQNNQRIGSFQSNEDNWKLINQSFDYYVLQIDVTGTTHIEITNIK